LNPYPDCEAAEDRTAEQLEIGVVDLRDAGAVQDEPTPDTGFGPPPGRY
jgi:hypothetical protein